MLQNRQVSKCATHCPRHQSLRDTEHFSRQLFPLPSCSTSRRLPASSSSGYSVLFGSFLALCCSNVFQLKYHRSFPQLTLTTGSNMALFTRASLSSARVNDTVLPRWVVHGSLVPLHWEAYRYLCAPKVNMDKGKTNGQQKKGANQCTTLNVTQGTSPRWSGNISSILLVFRWDSGR